MLSSLSTGFFDSVNICRRPLGIYQKLLSWGAGQNQRSEALRALGAKSGAVPGLKILFASVYTARRGTNTLVITRHDECGVLS